MIQTNLTNKFIAEYSLRKCIPEKFMEFEKAIHNFCVASQILMYY